MTSPKQTAGFTLIELVAVIVILGIMATAVSKYIVFGSQIYVEGTIRQQVLASSRFVMERLEIELKGALPNSIRVSNDNSCIEFVPIEASGTYRNDGNELPPIEPLSSNTMEVVSLQGSDVGHTAGDRLYIFAAAPNDIYVDNQNIDVTNANNNNQIGIINTVPAGQTSFTITFQNAVTFELGSPTRRYYTANSTVAYCLNNGDLFRFETQSISNANQTAVNVAANGVLMAEGINNNLNAFPAPFTVTGGGQGRNSIVSIYLEFGNLNQGENDMFYDQQVFIPNVP